MASLGYAPIRRSAARAAAQGRRAQAEAVDAVIDRILARPEHAWFEAERAQRAQGAPAAPPAPAAPRG